MIIKASNFPVILLYLTNSVYTVGICNNLIQYTCTDYTLLLYTYIQDIYNIR